MQKAIHLEGLRMPVSIGVHDFERQTPQEYVLDIVIGLPSNYHAVRDSIEETVNYDALRARVVDLLGSQHFNLQETVIQRVIDICFELDERVNWTDVRTRKTQVYQDCEAVGLQYRVSRSDWMQST